MSKLIVKIYKVSKIYNHPNADRLSIIEMEGNGWNCIVGKDNHKVGDLVIYCPPDSVIPNNIIEKYNLEFLKKNGRVGTIKLRKYISQGLILNLDCLPKKGYKEGTDVAKILGIKKYESPVSKNLQINGKPTKRKRNPLFDKYTDIDNIKNYNTIFKEGDLVVITEKLHGCLNANTKIQLYDGTVSKIKDIVDNKRNILLAGRDGSGKIIPVKITEYFHNGYTKQWKKVAFMRKGLKGNSTGKIICTPYHRFLNAKDDEYYEAKDLEANDYIYVTKIIYNIPKEIKDILIGKMLGDGSLSNNSIEFRHKYQHKNYIIFTLNNIGFLAGNLQKIRISGFGTKILPARTKSNESIFRMFESWYYRTKTKQVPPIKLSPISLAYWYMDDGSLSHTKLQKDRALFATCGFDEISIDNLLLALKELNIKGIKYLSEGKYWRIRLNTYEAYKMFFMIAPYIPKSMRYKLPEELRNLSYKPLPMYRKNLYRIVTTIQKIINISDYNNSKDNTAKYDLETESHNYIANGAIVHNSNFRTGKLPIHPGYTIIDKIKYLWNKYIIKKDYEFIYGSHNVQLTNFNKTKNFYGDDVYGRISKKYKLAEIIPEDYILYGEIYGAKIQELTYGLKDIDVAFFAVKYKGKYLDWNKFVEFCIYRLLPIVPILYIGEYKEEYVKKYTEGKSIKCPTQIREGCVILSEIEENHPRIGRKILKSVSEEYLLKKNRTEFH